MNQQLVRDLLYYDPETGKLFWKKRDISYFSGSYPCGAWCTWNKRFADKEAFTSFDKNGYLLGKIFGKSYRAHRIIWLWVYGKFPLEEIDHINHIKTDNRIINLRDVDKFINNQNRINSKGRG
jgi:hypothetical protein